MELLTNSARNLYQCCPRKFYYRHELGYKPIVDAHALRFGRLFHEALEKYYLGETLDDIFLHIRTSEADPFDQVKVIELLKGYDLKWGRPEQAIPELQYSIPLVNPKTMAKSRTFEIAGKIDALTKIKSPSEAVVEHKTSSEDISPGSNYWLKLDVDCQISGYFIGAESLGYSPKNILYDVVKKPGQRPFKATPEAQRKYKKDGTLYAAQHEFDETPAEYAERIRESIQGDLDAYYQRREIGRIETDLVEYLEDIWAVGKFIMESRNQGFWPRRVSQCFNYGTCPYFEVCAKRTTIENASLFVKADANEELSKEETDGF